MEIKKARIINTVFERKRNGALTIELHLASEDTGYFEYDRLLSLREFTGRNDVFLGAKEMEAVIKILELAGANRWDALRGRYIRIKCDDRGAQSFVVDEIGDIACDKWFNLREFFKS